VEHDQRPSRLGSDRRFRFRPRRASQGGPGGATSDGVTSDGVRELQGFVEEFQVEVEFECV